MNIKLFDSELKIMKLICQKEPVSAKDLSLTAGEEIGWNKNTTYTVIKKLEAKGYIKRSEPGFICTSLISEKEVCREEIQGLVKKLFNGSKKAFFSALLEDEKLSEEELNDLRQIIERR